jgi:glycosyltransferase involved in cell wall biosynthesis
MVITLFDLGIGGHHSVYIKHLVSYWKTNVTEGDVLHIVVVPDFLAKHSEVVDLSLNVKNINFVPISDEDNSKISSIHSSIVRSFVEWGFFCKYTHMLKTDHAYLLYFDHLQLPIILGNKPSSLFSGIYFRPTFHYHKFENYKPSFKDKFRAWRQKILLLAVLRNSKLEKLFCLDPFVVPLVNQWLNKPKAIHLPDPVEVTSIKASDLLKLRFNLGLKSDRKVFLIFGLLSGRKGIYQILEAVQNLPSEIAQQITLLLVGKIADTETAKMTSMVENAKNNSNVQIVTQYEFVSDRDVHAYFCLADVVLAIYQKHVGMSGILLQAAAANKPVISSDYGLMGQIAKIYNSGLIIDGSQVKNIEDSITKVLKVMSSDISDLQNPESINIIKEFTPSNFSKMLINQSS